MTMNDANLRRSLEILTDELLADEDFRQAFVHRPHHTLRGARDWGVALSDSELYSLIVAERYVYHEVADALQSQPMAA